MISDSQISSGDKINSDTTFSIIRNELRDEDDTDERINSASSSTRAIIGQIATAPRKPGKVMKSEDWQEYRRATKLLLDLANEMQQASMAGDEPDDRPDIIANIEDAVNRLYDVKFGKKECLARCAVEIESVILQAKWQANHVAFIRDVAKFLQTRGFVDQSTVGQIMEIVKSHNLDEFRGVLSD